MQALRDLSAHYAGRLALLRSGRPDAAWPVVACVGRDVPREVILAAGLLPVRLPGTPGQHTLGDRFCGPGIDEVARSQLSRILGGGLAGSVALAIGPDCEGSVRLFLYLREIQRLEPFPAVPPFTFVDCGHLPQASTGRYNRIRLDEFVDEVAGWAGRPVTDDDLCAAVRLTNESRRLIRALGRLRVDARISGADALRAIGAGFVLPPAEFQPLLNRLLDQAATTAARPGVRVFLTGSGHDHPGAYDLIESRGALIVGEDHDWGALAGLSDVDTVGDVRDALMRAYWRSAPTAAGYGIAERAEQTARLAGQAGAELVIAWRREHDPAPAWDIAAQRRILAEHGLPLLVLPTQPYGAAADPETVALLDQAVQVRAGR